MTDMTHFSDRVWDQLLDFIYQDERELTHDEVKAELMAAGINTRPYFSKLHSMVRHAQESANARAALEHARKQRPSILAKLMDMIAPSAPAIREKLQDLIQQKLSGPKKALYARKLQGASSDEDLKSLLEDLSRLDAFSEGSDDGGK